MAGYAQPNTSPYGQGLQGHPAHSGVGWTASLDPIPSPFSFNLDVATPTDETFESLLAQFGPSTAPIDTDTDTDPFDPLAVVVHPELQSLTTSHQALVDVQPDNELQLSLGPDSQQSEFTKALNELVGHITSSQQTADLFDQYVHTDAAAPSPPFRASQPLPTTPTSPLMSTVRGRSAHGRLHPEAVPAPTAVDGAHHHSLSPASAFTSPTAIDSAHFSDLHLHSPSMSIGDYVFPGELHGDSSGAGPSNIGHGEYDFDVNEDDNGSESGDDGKPPDEYRPPSSSSLSSVPPSRTSPPQPVATTSTPARPIRNLPARRTRAASRVARTPLPLDAPIQPRTYTANTLTSRKLIQNNLLQRLPQEKAVKLKRKLADIERAQTEERAEEDELEEDQEEDHDDEEEEEEEEEPEPPKKKSKGKGKAVAKPKPAPKGKGKGRAKPTARNDDDDDDSDALLEDEKRKADEKRFKNTMAARESRLRKAQELAELHAQIALLADQVEVQTQRADAAEDQVIQLQAQLAAYAQPEIGGWHGPQFFQQM